MNILAYLHCESLFLFTITFFIFYLTRAASKKVMLRPLSSAALDLLMVQEIRVNSELQFVRMFQILQTQPSTNNYLLPNLPLIPNFPRRSR